MVTEDVKKKIMELKTTFESAKAPAIACVDNFHAEKLAFKNNVSNSGDELFQQMAIVRQYIKDFPKCTEHKDLNDAVDALRTYKNRRMKPS